ncbi:MAG: EamA family transporter [Sphingobacteriales bacterium 17-39-43]|uniref:EamA family transporter n=1 Tax=Daejeonella sp. TaxID=2805397 RepID=UPI000BCD45FD|nr:EamA family transporter [Daejeonella sp.]OYZ31085.1 MAG: EamA family transporter [Sphingobacteriales bacterium 16-39-50]OYZ56654.1 MAG: EamA family transporter [Sphingobacteriales bacterium 24-40-4]OZA23926.1 MAG: EamA family transporter [Sphingobacteriales bacterium 17-39-43]HQS05674.1 EamA family transporter [Daejeonella sp.]HQS52464.1 EamA family transporter [Daejeonella sp.]
MSSPVKKSASLLMVVLAFAIVYIVWGSTYFFIQIAVKDFPPFILGALRFIIAGVLMVAWCIYKGENIFAAKGIKHAAISGILMLFCGNGIIIWVEQSMPSAMVAIMVSSAPLWFVLLDKPKWSENLRSKSIIAGMLIGLAGVILLFSEQVSEALSLQGSESVKMSSMVMLVIAAITWSGGSLYSKYKSSEDPIIVTSTWQMIAAGIAFLPGIIIRDEFNGFQWKDVSGDAWMAVIYLVVLGSIAGFSAYVWLLKERPAMQVSTYAYVNPVVAVLLGVFFANEQISSIQVIGLIIILGSVFMINMARYRREKLAERKMAAAE